MNQSNGAGPEPENDCSSRHYRETHRKIQLDNRKSSAPVHEGGGDLADYEHTPDQAESEETE